MKKRKTGQSWEALNGQARGKKNKIVLPKNTLFAAKIDLDCKLITQKTDKQQQNKYLIRNNCIFKIGQKLSLGTISFLRHADILVCFCPSPVERLSGYMGELVV